MPDESMATSPIKLRSILPELSSALTAFQASKSRFQVVKTINPPSTAAPAPKTLYILDSSFNPPSKAHLTLAKSALHSGSTSAHQGPYRLLLLFSTHNADKAPSAASFPQRLALMAVFAQDLINNLTASNTISGAFHVPTIDIGLTTAPYYTDKSEAINSDDEGKDIYPNEPKHIHILGYDTLTRFFAAKYYPSFSPPLSALNPYFEAGHVLRATLRPTDEYGSVQDQKDFIARLEKGDMEHEGGKKEWAGQIEVIEAGAGVGVSSTKVRHAAKRGDWNEVKSLCTDGVAAAVEEEQIYADDDRGAKMA